MAENIDYLSSLGVEALSATHASFFVDRLAGWPGGFERRSEASLARRAENTAHREFLTLSIPIPFTP
jgi:hypothetical protein